MELSRLNVLIWMLIFIGINISNAQEEDDDSIEARFHSDLPSEQLCVYRRQEGHCKRRSQCQRPTRQRCRYGLDPIVCCLDQHFTIATTRRITTTTTTTTRRPATARTTRKSTTRRVTSEPQIGKESYDITYPNCGLRSQKGQASPNRNNVGRGVSSRRGILPSVGSLLGVGVTEKVIVGGVVAAEHSWPWMAAIFKSSGSGAPNRFLCGASLVSRRFVVTAAHCFDGEKGAIDPSQYSVILGSHQTRDGTEYRVDKVVRHQEYRRPQHYHDLCVLRLVSPAQLNPKVHPVCLPSEGLRGKIRKGENDVTVTGWGDTSFGGVGSKVLREVELPIVPLKRCNESYWKLSRSAFPRGVTQHFICAGLQEGGKDACQGDSGGPMVTKLTDNSWAQLGVVSFGRGCAQPGFPGVYTRLSHYTKWLYDNTDLGQ